MGNSPQRLLCLSACVLMLSANTAFAANNRTALVIGNGHSGNQDRSGFQESTYRRFQGLRNQTDPLGILFTDGRFLFQPPGRPRSRHHEDFVMVPRTTPAVFDLDPRTDADSVTEIEFPGLTEPVQAYVPDVIAPDGRLPDTTVAEAPAEQQKENAPS